MKLENYRYNNSIKSDRSLVQSFNNLVKEVFGFDFSKWDELGFWTDLYIPHVLIDDGEVIANVSVNIINKVIDQVETRCIQIGTVMCKEAYRNQGCIDFLMRKVLDQYQNSAEIMYLYANETVLNFYQKFGFKESVSYEYYQSVSPNKTKWRRLNPLLEIDRACMSRLFAQGNPYARIVSKENSGLFYFYCTQSLSECVYYNDVYDAIVIYDSEENLVYEILADKSVAPIDVLLGELAEISEVLLGFTPKQVDRVVINQNSDLHFFLLAPNHPDFTAKKWVFPYLSIA